MKIDEKYLKSLEEFGIGVQTLDERTELIRLARVGLEVERNLTKRAVDLATTSGKSAVVAGQEYMANKRGNPVTPSH
jgi:hypothetical protein